MVCSCTTTDLHTVETLPDGWKTIAVDVENDKGKISTYYDQLDLKTGQRYWHEPMLTTALKCALLIVVIPIYLFAYVAWHVIRAPIAATIVPIRALNTFLRQPSKDHLRSIGLALVWEAPKNLGKSVWDIVKAPFYAIAMEFAALCGVFSPTKMRVWVGEIEKQWHGVDCRKDSRHYWNKTPKDNIQKYCRRMSNFLWEALTDPNSKNTCYLAFCMQPWGNIKDTDIQRVTYYAPGSRLPL